MSTLFFALAFVLVALLVYVGRYSARVQAQASRLIAAPPEQVYARVSDLSQWRAWNPWLALAPDHLATLRADGQGLSWAAAEVSTAQLQQNRAEPPRALRQQLDFALPFRCRGRSQWRFEPEGAGTRVSWQFKGRVGFSLRAFAATVQGALALDLRLGLDRLAAVLEAGPPAYRLTPLGAQEQPLRLMAQRKHHGRLQDLPTDIARATAEVRQALSEAALPADGLATVHYLRTHLKRREVDSRIGIELPAAPTPPLPPGLSVQTLPAHRAWVMRFSGPARDLELAWYQGMQGLRIGQHAPHPTLPPYERYWADADAEGRVVVELYLPLKP